MGLFDSLFRRAKTPLSPEQLRQALFSAIEARSGWRLGRLCRQYHEEIVREFPQWKTVPEAIRHELAEVDRYAQRMAALADYFVRARRDPRLWQQLTGPEESNPIVQWPKRLQQALRLMEETRFREAIALLSDTLIDYGPLQDFRGNLVADCLAKTYGHLGYCHFQVGGAEKALAPQAKALDLCQQHGDAEGTIAYLGNLFESHRYLGQSGPAADYAGRLAEALGTRGKADDAAWFRKQEAVVRAGEPLVRLIAVVDGRNFESYELEDALARENVRVQVVFYRNRLTLKPAAKRTAEGEAAGGRGDFDQALDLFRAAADADRFDPHPNYQAGVTLLYLGRYTEAVESYARTEELAPGWFYCRRYLWLAERLALGRLEHETFLVLEALDEERQDLSPQAKVALAEKALAGTPGVAWLHFALGRNLNALQRPAEAQKAFREGLACADESDVRSCLAIELAGFLDPGSPERNRLLDEARDPSGNLMSAALADYFLKRGVTS